MAINGVLAGDFLGNLAGGEQFNQVLVEGMHTLANSSFNDAIQEASSFSAIAFDGGIEALSDDGFQIA
jgi:hypothetical protein